MITTERMAAVDANAAALGVPRKQLMESSGNAVAREVRDVGDPETGVALVCGRGNNGGDALVAARFLSADDLTVHLLGRPESIRTEIARENWEALEAAEIPTRVVGDSADLALGEPNVVVDAMLGSGASGALREPERTAARAINDASESGSTVVSVDVPSGIDADTGGRTGGADAVAVEPDRVVTFHDEKPGLASLDAAVTVADIGIPAAAERFRAPAICSGSVASRPLTRETTAKYWSSAAVRTRVRRRSRHGPPSERERTSFASPVRKRSPGKYRGSPPT